MSIYFFASLIPKPEHTATVEAELWRIAPASTTAPAADGWSRRRT